MQKYIVAPIIIVLLIALASVSLYVVHKYPTEIQHTTTASLTPKKIDFKTSLPAGFPTDIPVEKGAEFNQSYSVDYSGKKQLTVVFKSISTIEENKDQYSTFFKTNNWTTLNRYATNTIASFYETKGSIIANVTISQVNTAQHPSQVSISVFVGDPVIPTTGLSDTNTDAKLDSVARLELLKNKNPDFYNKLIKLNAATTPTQLNLLKGMNPALRAEVMSLTSITTKSQVKK